MSGEDRNANSNGEWGAGQAGDEHSGNFEIRRMNRMMEVSNNLLNSRNAASDEGMVSDRMIPRRPGSVHRNDRGQGSVRGSPQVVRNDQVSCADSVGCVRRRSNRAGRLESKTHSGSKESRWIGKVV